MTTAVPQRSLIVQAFMRALGVVIIQPLRRHLLRFLQTSTLLKQEKVMLVGAPKALHDDVVCPAAFTIHADGYAVA